MLSAKELSTAYFDWTTKSIQFIEKESFVQVKTPFVDMYHDRTELVVKKAGAFHCIWWRLYIGWVRYTGPTFIWFKGN